VTNDKTNLITLFKMKKIADQGISSSQSFSSTENNNKERKIILVEAVECLSTKR